VAEYFIYTGSFSNIKVAETGILIPNTAISWLIFYLLAWQIYGTIFHT